MQTWLKISFWFSLVVLILADFMLCDCPKLFMTAAVFALPGLLIKSVPYKMMSVAVVCIALAAAYHQYTV